jgi:hypothetical protein
MTKSALFNINSRNGSGYGILSSDWRIIQLTAVLVFLFSALARAQPPGKTLIVVAHPDDEYYFAATVYRMAVQLRGTVDELVTTNGEGDFTTPHWQNPSMARLWRLKSLDVGNSPRSVEKKP